MCKWRREDARGLTKCAPNALIMVQTNENAAQKQNALAEDGTFSQQTDDDEATLVCWAQPVKIKKEKLR